MRHSLEQDETCYFLDDPDITLSDSVQEVVQDDPLKLCIDKAKEEEEDDLKIFEQLACLEANGIVVQRKEFEDIDGSRGTKLKPSIKDSLTLELKELPYHFEYVFLGEGSKLPLIITSNLKVDEKEKLLKVLC